MKCLEVGGQCPYGLHQPEKEFCSWCATIREIHGAKPKPKRSHREEYENLAPTDDYIEETEEEDESP